MGAFTRVTEYTVSVFPPEMADSDDRMAAEEADTWSLKVTWRGQGRWAVLHGPFCLGADGYMDYERSPSERGDDWLATHRFPLDAALELAAEHAAAVTVNGRTAREILAKHQARAQSAPACKPPAKTAARKDAG